MPSCGRSRNVGIRSLAGALKPVERRGVGKLRHRVPSLSVRAALVEIAEVCMPVQLTDFTGRLARVSSLGAERQGSMRIASTESGPKAVGPQSRLSAPYTQGDLGGLDDIIGFHIRLAHGAAYRHFTETFAELRPDAEDGLGPLAGRANFPASRRSTLGRRLRMDRATTMTIVNRLAGRASYLRARAFGRGRPPAGALPDGCRHRPRLSEATALRRCATSPG